MIVDLTVSPEAGVEAIHDGTGRVVGLRFSPLFSSGRGSAVLAYFESKSDAGKVLERFSLVASGASGSVAKKTRTATKRAAVDTIGGEDGKQEG